MILRLLLALVAVASSSSCSSLLYAPTRGKYYDPKTLKLDYEEVSFPSLTPDRKLGGWYFPSKTAERRAVVVFFHGNAENLSSHFITLAFLPQYGFEYFIFDYQGYGPSEGEPSPKGTIDDGIAAMRWVKQKVGDLPIIVFGQSLGGAVAMRTVLEVKNEIPVKWLVVDSTFESYQSAGASVLRSHWLTWILQPFAYLTLSDRWSPEGRVNEISPIPMLVIHGTEDRVISDKLGREVFENAAEPKEFWEIPGGHHIDVFAAHDGIYRQKFLDRLTQKFPKAPATPEKKNPRTPKSPGAKVSRN